jgi:hypothetical protein
MDSAVNYIFNLMTIERHLNRFRILIILIFRLTLILETQGRYMLQDNHSKQPLSSENL